MSLSQFNLRLLASSGLALALAACATSDDGVMAPEAPSALAPPPAAVPPDAVAANANEEKDDGDEPIDSMIDAVGDKVVEEDLPAGASSALRPAPGLPLESNAEVERWIEYFTVKDRDRFQRFLERGERYRPAVMAVLKDQGIPTEIFYQAMIESGFATAATSRARAVGIWQFVKGTGKRYGLREDAYVDERRDPLRATIAASLYMKDLYNVFQSWYLAMAAYNAGEGRVMAAIMRAKTRDFWEMARTGALPAETMNYVPKFLAATIIGQQPGKYGFDDLSRETQPALVSVAVPAPVRLSDIASLSGVPLAALREYNPHLLRGMTPPGTPTYRIWVPKDQVDAVEAQTEQLAARRIKGVRQITSTADNSRPKYHTVVQGETLAQVAALYGLSSKQLRRLNHLSSDYVSAGRRLTLWVAEPAAYTYKRYKVKRGDNLDVIARRFGVSIEVLKKMNSLRRNRVYVGQVLKVGSQKG